MSVLSVLPGDVQRVQARWAELGNMEVHWFPAMQQGTPSSKELVSKEAAGARPVVTAWRFNGSVHRSTTCGHGLKWVGCAQLSRGHAGLQHIIIVLPKQRQEDFLHKLPHSTAGVEHTRILTCTQDQVTPSSFRAQPFDLSGNAMPPCWSRLYHGISSAVHVR